MLPVLDNEPLTAQDQTALDYLYSVVADRLGSAQVNSWVEVRIKKQTARPRVVATLKQRVEVDGRQVGVFDESEYWRLTIPPLVAALPALAALTPAIVPAVAQGDGPRVLIRMPTRGRPAQALSTLAAYRTLAGYPVSIEVVIDSDDEIMLASEVLQRFCTLGADVTVGPHRSKVEAMNGGRVADWDILVLASDDMVPVESGYAKAIADEMLRHFPHLDGLVYFDDGYVGGRACTLPIIGRRLYDQFGAVYHSDYRSLYCDLEQTDVLRSMRRIAYVERMLIEHRHPATGKAPYNALYDKNDRDREEDRMIYERRRMMQRPHAQFGFDAPPVALSICIASLPARRAQCDRLVTYLYGQIVRDVPRQVEILVDDGPGEIGAKRQRLIERAIGHYVAHIDDDDWVSYDYMRRVVYAVEASDYAADCVALAGVVTTRGSNPARFYHSLQYREWCTAGDGTHYRSPNHLNPVRRELALSAGFPVGMSHGEDHVFSRRLLPLLKREAPCDGGPLYHYWFEPEKR